MISAASLKVEVEGCGRYLPGSEMRGKVVLTVTQPGVIKALRLKVMGKEFARSWREGYNFQDQRTYLNTTFMLFGTPDGSQRTEKIVSRGEYEYPFAFVLPSRIPPSTKVVAYHCGSAEIKYHVVASADLVNDTLTEEVEILVDSVMNTRDFTTPSACTVEETLSNDVCCWPCCGSSGDVTFKVEMPTRRFLIGRDEARLTLTLTNTSSNPIKGITVTLQGRNSFKVHCYNFASLPTVYTHDIPVKIASNATRRFAIVAPIPCMEKGTEGTTKGGIMTTQYSIVLRADMDGECPSCTVGDIILAHGLSDSALSCDDEGVSYPVEESEVVYRYSPPKGTRVVPLGNFADCGTPYTAKPTVASYTPVPWVVPESVPKTRLVDVREGGETHVRSLLMQSPFP